MLLVPHLKMIHIHTYTHIYIFNTPVPSNPPP